MSEPSTRAPLSGEDLETWASLATVLEWLPTALDAQLQSAAGLTHFEYGVMYALAHAPGRTLRMSVLAGYANSTLSRLSRAASRLESKDWLKRTTDPTDGRYTLATLTDLGAQKVEQATPGHVDTVRRLVLEPLTQAQRRNLREVNRRILRSIRDEGGWRPPTGVSG
ncbi:MarR family winged helix-turn-helix transcriptional regulator [Georgenia satyanarayanai]|uniref:MarR family winged helix-turn-helix transcriptional regulator n=1 Tax=Georgenia satyanarayanai TaxID=860221 RepID=UPI001264E248|nr:MarR family transcriptional regulator [Georgenia satyanarayanai]